MPSFHLVISRRIRNSSKFIIKERKYLASSIESFLVYRQRYLPSPLLATFIYNIDQIQSVLPVRIFNNYNFQRGVLRVILLHLL